MVGSAVLYAFISTTLGPTAGLAEDSVFSKMVEGEVTLDLDRDGKTDRAVLVRNSANASVDLYIYFGAGGDTLDVSRRPTIFKKDIAGGAAVAIESGPNGGLTIKYGCGGCSNDTVTELKLVYRGGKILVGGFTVDWDTRSAIGSCDVNLLTGKGFVKRGLGHGGKPIKVHSSPVALSAWSHDVITKICP